MAKSGHLPDCVHCRFMERHASSEYRCVKNNITLHTPIGLFCKHLTPQPDMDEVYLEWFEGAVDRDTLDPNILYLWLTAQVNDKNGQTETISTIGEMASITNYAHWSAGIFWNMLRDKRLSHQKKSQKHPNISIKSD